MFVERPAHTGRLQSQREMKRIINISVNLNAIFNLFSRESLLDAVGGGGDGLGVETGLLLDDS